MARIVPFRDWPDKRSARLEIEAIFFANAATRAFVSEAERGAYLELWLGRYLRHCPEEVFLAADGDGGVAGYLAGALSSEAEPLAGPDYYALFPRAAIERFPAHIHVNVRENRRGRGVGGALIDRFRAHCRARGASGFHAVTAADSAAAAFFQACGLTDATAAFWRGRPIVLLGEALM